MKTVTFTEFRKNASELLSDVERGQALVIIRHGRPIARVTPFVVPSPIRAWRRPALRLSADGTSLAAAILGERMEEDVL